MIDKTRVKHEPDRSCGDDHCYSCHVDEPGDGYIVCPECFHVYRTAADLRRAYRRKLIRAHRNRVPQPYPFDVPDPSWATILWRALTVRAKDITFCQHCIHDF